MKTITPAWAVLARAFAAALVLTTGGIASGCSRSSAPADISATSFRADPSKMTPAEKQNFNKVMRNSNAPANKQ